MAIFWDMTLRQGTWESASECNWTPASHPRWPRSVMCTRLPSSVMRRCVTVWPQTSATCQKNEHLNYSLRESKNSRRYFHLCYHRTVCYSSRLFCVPYFMHRLMLLLLPLIMITMSKGRWRKAKSLLKSFRKFNYRHWHFLQ